MKIDRIRAFEVDLGLRLGPYKSAVGTIDALTTTIVAVDTDEGLTGWGEVCPYGANYLPALHGAVKPVLAELSGALLGRDPRKIGVIEAAMDQAVCDQNFVKTAVDYACWDILGKATGLPVECLLGGRQTERLSLIASVPGDIDAMASVVGTYRDQGYRQFSLHISAPSQRDLNVCRDVLSDLGGDERAVLDGNRTWSLLSAVEVARALADLRIALEQPCADIAQCAALRARIDLPIVLDEVIVTPGDLLQAASLGAVDAIALKIGRCGGLTKTRRICDLADALGIRYWIKDVIGAEIVTAATAHLAHSRAPKSLAGALSCSDLVDREIADTAVRHLNGEMFVDGALPGLGVAPHPDVLGAPVFELRP
jgi:L-alanine-DL-glutamate epimerase-like enolase superfamily enzyme